MRRIPSAGSTLSTGLSKLHRPGDGAAFSAAVRMVAHIAGESSEIPGKLPMIFLVLGRKFPCPAKSSTPSSRKQTGTPFAAHPLRVAFEGQGEYGFFAWTDSTHDPVETVLEEGDFRTTGDCLHPGDLIFAGVSPRPANSPWSLPTGPMRRVLPMVTGHEGAAVEVRLVQDYGGPDDPSVPLREPPKPRRSRRKKREDGAA